jgi:hypothetical protein
MSGEGKKNSKQGRNQMWCKVYRDMNRRFTNKLKKIERHLKRHPGDVQSKSALKALLS